MRDGREPKNASGVSLFFPDFFYLDSWGARGRGVQNETITQDQSHFYSRARRGIFEKSYQKMKGLSP